MAANVTGMLWSLEQLFDEINNLVWRRKRGARINKMLERMRTVLG